MYVIFISYPFAAHKLLILKTEKKKRKNPFRFQAFLHFFALMLHVLKSWLMGARELHDVSW